MVVRMLWHGRPAHVPISTGKLPVSRCPILMRGTSQTNRACARTLSFSEKLADGDKRPLNQHLATFGTDLA